MKLTSKLKNKLLSYYSAVVTKLLWIKYRNRPYIEFYRAVMKHTSRMDMRSSTGFGNWEERSEKQLARLKKYGMEPQDTLFELGCGQLRGGRSSINYLERGNYYGNDISPQVLEEANKVLEEDKLSDKKPNLFLTNNLEFREVESKKFDFIHAQSVLSHMPPEDIETLFKNVKKIMHKDTQFLASFFLSKDGTIYPFHFMKNFAFPIEWMQETGEKYGLEVELVEPQGKQKLMRITLA